MGKWSYADMLDAALSALTGGTSIFYLLTGDPEEYGDIDSGNCQILSSWSKGSNSFSSIFNGSAGGPPDEEPEEEVEYDNTGRGIQIARVAIGSVDIDGSPSIIALCSLSDLLYKTTVSGATLTAGDPLVIDAWNIIIHEPT